MTKKNVLYISPEFPENFQNFIRSLNHNGIGVYAIGEGDFHTMPEEIRSMISWYERINLYDHFEVIAAVKRIQNRIYETGQGQIDYVESHNEHWLRAEAFINAEFNIPGIKGSEIELWKRKSLMKKAMIELGFNVAPGQMVGTQEETLAFADKVGYPIILKPDDGVGATRTYKVNNEEELKSIFPCVDQTFFIEKFLYGEMVTFDGLTDLDGNIVFENSLVYGCGVLDNVQGQDSFFYTRREVPEALAKMGRAIVKKFGIKRKFFHLEFFETQDGIVPLEVNARVPGGPIIDLCNYSIDASLFDAWAKILKGENPGTLKPKKYFTAYMGRRDRNYRYPHDEVVGLYGHQMMDFGMNPHLFVQAMGRYKYLCRTETLEELYQIRNFIFEGC